MQLRLDKLAIDEIRNLPLSNISVKIERFGASINILNALNSRLAYSQVPIVLSIDGREQSSETTLVGLDIFQVLCWAGDISMNAVLTLPVQSIEQLSKVRDITRLRLRGYFDKKIDLGVIEKFSNLVELEFELGVNKKQLEVINKCKKLQTLAVARLDLNGLFRNENINKLRVGQLLSNSRLLVDKTPNLVEIDLEKCKDQGNFAFISELPNISSLTFRYVKSMRNMCMTKNPKKLKTLQFIGASALESVGSLEQADELENLLMTDLENVEVDDFFVLKKLKSLKCAYVTFKDPKKNAKVKKFIEDEGWLYQQPGL
ncbi:MULTISPECIES: hypothetical protein [Paraburkholderia]|jgi:hypothetical protein|uniref:Uncharacterized protein n=1 Tax=Paraburkholderia largidicola TaxID=3014751 RepID=A0A7I8BJ81_9BURK|nr:MULTISPECIES: hypothetical protein [Paraburkholderia]BCF88757.1 hypothetical protein PPGU16_18240 [Paraburkholderia sp. PGU16]GJH00286.1 hypothetical protein CBA19C8_07035 [Paraburkholderia terrae]GJH31376.1 hypothetical protein CBA19CS91_01485 [Paraburkholderia hospita]CAG9255741.1 conserved hypothetical protein [Paraburkholderia caribensis]